MTFEGQLTNRLQAQCALLAFNVHGLEFATMFTIRDRLLNGIVATRVTDHLGVKSAVQLIMIQPFS